MITSATENVVIVVFVDIVVTVDIVVFYNVRGIAWKAILSEAVGFACDLTRRRRTRGRSPRYINAEQLPGRQYLVSDYTYSKVLSYRQFSPIRLTPGLCPGLRTLRLVQPYRLTDA